MSLVSAPSIVKITSFVKSLLPILSSSKTLFGIFLNSSTTSSLNTVLIPYLYIILNISTPGSSLFP